MEAMETALDYKMNVIFTPETYVWLFFIFHSSSTTP